MQVFNFTVCYSVNNNNYDYAYFTTGIEVALATVELLGSVSSATSSIVTLWFPVSTCNIATMHKWCHEHNYEPL